MGPRSKIPTKLVLYKGNTLHRKLRDTEKEALNTSSIKRVTLYKREIDFGEHLLFETGI